ncbi:MAG: SAM-dependent methyltransferase, partial [Chloroflexota bacterium]|nr:SAM-dependent methyltransferase [Chloroflexota bacterium]
GYARPPEKNGDYAFLLHMVKSLKSTGKGAVILPHGVLFRGNAEAVIRRSLVQRGYIKGIIGLPPNLFYGTGIPTCIILLDKEGAANRTGIYMVDASKGFAKDGPKNRLRPRDMHRIVDAVTRQQEVPRYARLVPIDEIADPKNGYNLNIPRYIDASELEDIQDLRAHLHGGIPDRDLDALQPYWDAFPSLRATLFRPLRDGYSELAVDKTEIQAAISGSSEYETFSATVADLVAEWWSNHRAHFTAITATTRPADLIATLGESLLDLFRSRPLIDEYGVYEKLMSYWHEVMHDDVALIMIDDWEGAARPRKAIEDKDRRLAETPDLVVGGGRSAAKYRMDLVPPDLIVNRFFAADRAVIDELETEAEAATLAVEEYIEENAGEEGLLAAAMDEDRISKALAKARTAQTVKVTGTTDEVAALNRLIALYDTEASAKACFKAATATLDRMTLEQYGKLTTTDIQGIVIDDKWSATIASGVSAELDALSRHLVGRLHVLADRYEATLGDFESEVERLSAKATEHLLAMGVG